MMSDSDFANDINVIAGPKGQRGLARIKKAARRLRKFCTLIMVLLPLGVAYFWFNPDNVPPMDKLPAPVTPDTPGLTLFLGFLVSLIPLSVGLWSLSRLRLLFKLYEAGLIFHQKNIRCLQSLGRALIAWVVASFLTHPLLGVMLTYHKPPGQRILSIGLGSQDIAALLAGFVVLVIAWVMEQGRKMQEDQALII